MRLSVTLMQLLVVAGACAAVTAACGGNSSGDNGVGAGNATGSGKSGEGPTGSGNSSASGGAGDDGPDLQLGGDTGQDPDPDGPIDACAGDLVEAKYIPLDMYIMLDKSGSMLDSTEGNPNQTKWEAVSAALADFLGDPESAGLGVGLQLFPLLHPDAPTSCTSDNQCDAFGPCLTKACWPLQNGLLSICLDEGDCGILQNCVQFGECANDKNYVCNRQTTANCGMGLGACAAPVSTCLMTDDCRSASYAEPAAAIAELPDAETALLAVIADAVPEGLTPSGPALTGALSQASAWAEQHPDRQVVAVLATDGMPTLQEDTMSCEFISLQSEVDAVADIAAGGLGGTPSISTFVIGVMGPNDVGGPETLTAIARAGGTKEAFIVDTQGDVSEQFRAALNQIRGTRLSCELAIPEPQAGDELDFDKVNVTFDDGSGAETVLKVKDDSACNAGSGGWYYDVAPSDGTPQRIVVCPVTCDAFEHVAMGSVQIQLGCTTQTEPVK